MLANGIVTLLIKIHLILILDSRFFNNALGGVFVYTPSSFEALQVGDEVNLNGQVEEYYGLTEIKNIMMWK